MGRLKVTIISARDLQGKDFGGTSDPFVVVTIGQIKHKTDHLSKTCNPVWNTSLYFDLPPIINASTETATFEVFDYDRFGNSDLIGRTTVALGTLYKGQSQKIDLRLSKSKNGVLSIEMLAEDFGLSTPSAPSQHTTQPQQVPPPQQYPPQQYGQQQYPQQPQPQQPFYGQYSQQQYPQQAMMPQGYPQQPMMQQPMMQGGYYPPPQQQPMMQGFLPQYYGQFPPQQYPGYPYYQ